ncbi:transcriptional regulator [Methylobacterium sp. SI9]|uniref:helix-turn-helix transcriptional regulator n=1 Tax=Methylobacterium guangdongense TaxID=3138811 RepID=UPI00313EE561
MIPKSEVTSHSDDLLDEHAVAKRQRRSVKTLRNQRVAGDGIPYLKLGRSVRYRLSDVIAWEQARLRTSTGDVGEMS